MPQQSSKKMRLWPALITAVVVIAVGLLAWTGPLANLLPWGSAADSSNTQVINSINRQEEVALLSLGIQGISQDSDATTLFNMHIPGSEKATFIQYDFAAKLGINGQDVTIEQNGPDEFLVAIPEFIFIGHDDIHFDVITEDNGVLSWITPEIQQVDLVNKVLDDEAQGEYLESNEEILQDQAQNFYEGIITSVDPDAVVEFEFSE